MPCDYKQYHPEWKTRIRPDILIRAGNKCECCGVPNGMKIIRGEWNGVECYQDLNGNIFDASNSKDIGEDYVGEVHPTNKIIMIVLTISHTDHDISNNDYGNLKALCQRCHNRHDLIYRKRKNRNKNQLNLF